MDLEKKGSGPEKLNRINSILEEKNLLLRLKDFFCYYKEYYWPLAKESIKNSLLGRALVFWRNQLIVNLGVLNPIEYNSWLNSWNNSRNICRSIKSWESFNKIRNIFGQKKQDDPNLFRIFFLFNLAQWFFFLIINAGWNIYKNGFSIYWLFGLTSSIIFTCYQLQYILIEKDIEKLKIKTKIDLIVGISRNIILNLLILFHKRIPRIFLTVNFINLFFDWSQWYLSINRQSPQKIFDIFKNLEEIKRFYINNILESNEMLTIILSNGLNCFGRGLIGTTIKEIGFNFLKEKKLIVNHSMASNNFYLFYNIYSQLFSWMERDLTRSAEQHFNFKNHETKREFITQWKTQNLVFHPHTFIYGLLFLKPELLNFLSISLNNILGFFINSERGANNANWIQKSPSTIILTRGMITMAWLNQSMISINEIAWSWEPIIFKFETIFSFFYNIIPMIIIKDYFLADIMSETLYFLLIWGWFYRKFFYHPLKNTLLLNKEEGRKMTLYLFPKSILALIARVCFLYYESRILYAH